MKSALLILFLIVSSNLIGFCCKCVSASEFGNKKEETRMKENGWRTVETWSFTLGTGGILSLFVQQLRLSFRDIAEKFGDLHEIFRTKTVSSIKKKWLKRKVTLSRVFKAVVYMSIPLLCFLAFTIFLFFIDL